MIYDEKALCMFHFLDQEMFVRKNDIIFIKYSAPVESLMIHSIKADI